MTVRRLGIAAVIVAVFIIGSRFLGLIRDAVLAGTFGQGAETDAFINSLLIVNSVAAVLLYALVTVVIPEFQKERARTGEASAWGLASSLAAWVSMILIILSGVLAVFPVVGTLPFAFDEALSSEMEPLIRIMAPAMLLQGLSALFTALLQIHGRFAGPAAVGVAFNVGIIGAIVLLSDRIGIEAAAWGVVAGAIFQIILQLPHFFRLMRGVDARFSLTHPSLLGTAALAGPIFAASIVQQINNFSDKMFAATLDPGSITALTFANTLGQAPRSILLLPLLTPLFPLMARFIAEQRRGEAVQTYRRAAGLLGVLAMPAAAFIVIYAHELSQLFFGRGKCDEQCVENTASPLAFYGLAVWGGFMGYLHNRVLSASGRTREVMIATIIVVVLTIAFDFALIGPMENAGLALASAIALFINAGVTFRFVQREFPELGGGELLSQQARILVAALVGVGVALLANLLVPTGTESGLALLGLLATKAAIGGLTYGVALRFIAPKEFEESKRLLRSALRRARPATG